MGAASQLIQCMQFSSHQGLLRHESLSIYNGPEASTSRTLMGDCQSFGTPSWRDSNGLARQKSCARPESAAVILTSRLLQESDWIKVSLFAWKVCRMYHYLFANTSLISERSACLAGNFLGMYKANYLQRPPICWCSFTVSENLLYALHWVNWPSGQPWACLVIVMKLCNAHLSTWRSIDGLYGCL